jgi:hypothetical protein
VVVHVLANALIAGRRAMADLTVNTRREILARFQSAATGTQPQQSRQRSE